MAGEAIVYSPSSRQASSHRQSSLAGIEPGLGVSATRCGPARSLPHIISLPVRILGTLLQSVHMSSYTGSDKICTKGGTFHPKGGDDFFDMMVDGASI